MRVHMIAAIAATCLMLTACGDRPGDRALSGGAIGAGVGAVGAAVLDANPVTGALVGAGVGAVTGAVTNKHQINLGH